MTKASTILGVDDEEPARTAIVRILRGAGYVVIPVERGLDAHWCVERHGLSVDLVIADFARPEADHYHLGVPIRALLSHTPVLFVSSHPRDDSIRRGLLRPHTPFLRKPFPPSALTRAVR